jgi:LemA protein
MTILIAIVVILVLWFVLSYNGLVRLSNRAKEAWADIDIQLKRRFDLIPNLVNTIKGSTNFEQETLTQVVEARAKATSIQIDPSKVTPETMKSISDSQGALSQAVGRLLVVAEQYPDLKSSSNFLDLQHELSDTENKIQAARRFYNTNVRDFNTKIQSFPTNIISKLFSFTTLQFFQLESDSAEKEPVAVKF